MGNRPAEDTVPMDTEESMGDRIRRLRVARNLSLQQLADKLVSMGAPSTLGRAAISKWESGETKDLKNETLILLIEALSTDGRYLLWDEDRQPQRLRRTTTPGAKRG